MILLKKITQCQSKIVKAVASLGNLLQECGGLQVRGVCPTGTLLLRKAHLSVAQSASNCYAVGARIDKF